MSAGETLDRERAMKRVRRFYSISAEREWERLERPVDGALEFAVHKAWISRNLPDAPAKVLDIGGGPGRYAIWLAQQGYDVTLADLSPDLLQVAGREADVAGVTLAALVEANAIDLTQFADGSFDAALCMGPMYHLIQEDDRRRVAAELHRVLGASGVAFTVFLNRLQTLRVAVNQDIPFFTPYTFDIVKKYHDEGILDFPIPGTFNLAYLIRPEEVAPFMESVGFETLDLVSSQSLAGDVQKHLAQFSQNQPELYEWVLAELVEVANEPSILGSGFHIMHIGRKP